MNTYISLLWAVSANAERGVMSETKVTKKEIIKRLIESLPKLLGQIDFIEDIQFKSEFDIQLSKENMDHDLIAVVKTTDKKEYKFLFEVKQHGHPLHARTAALQLKRYIERKENHYGVLAATYISEKSMQICREYEIGFIDLAGNCLLSFDKIYIFIEGRKNIYKRKGTLKSIFSGKSEQVLRVLLSDTKKEWFVNELSKEANVSIGHTSNIKKLLLDYEYLKYIETSKKSKFIVNNPEALLKDWSKNYSYRKNTIRNFYSLENIETLERKLVNYLEDNRLSYALTLASGSSKVAPFLRYNRVYCYLNKDDIHQITKDMKLKEVSSGPNLTFLEPYDTAVFYDLQDIQGTKVVSDIQLYLDLQSYKGRGEEAADFLLEKRIKVKW